MVAPLDVFAFRMYLLKPKHLIGVCNILSKAQIEEKTTMKHDSSSFNELAGLKLPTTPQSIVLAVGFSGVLTALGGSLIDKVRICLAMS